MDLLRILLVVFILSCGVPLAAVVAATVAMADDGDGGGGGGDDGGGGDSSGSGEAWQPPNPGQSNQRLRCKCGGFLGIQCSCRTVRVARNRPAAASTSPTEIVAIGLTGDDLAALTARGFRPVSSRQSALLGQSVSRIQPPRRVSFRRALALARSTVPGRTFAANDLYPTARPVFRPAGTLCGQGCPAFQLTNWRADVGRCAARATIGVIDTGVDSSHPVFATSRIETLTIRSEDRAPSGRDHGTGVVSLLVGDAGDYSGAAPGARVVAVDAFHGGKSGDIADTYDLVAAIDLLVERRIKVINLSLSGPDNPLLRDVVAKATAAGTVLVAAAGSSQGGTQSGFPARYPGVLAVSAIDGRLRSASGSQRGDHIAFSAPGVGISVANADKGYATVRGSSFAAPFVSAAYAMALETVRDSEQATRLIASAAKDLGAPGRDGVFGWGLVQYSALPPC